MVRPLQFLWRRLGRHYVRLAMLAWFPVGFFVAMGGLGLLRLYQDMTAEQFWILAAVALGLVAIELCLAIFVAFRMLRPANAWLRHRRPEDALEAWRTLSRLPLRCVSFRWWLAVPVNVVPISVFITDYLNLEWYAVPILIAASGVVVTYGVLLRFFGLESLLRPALEAAALEVPSGVVMEGAAKLPLRWRLMIALPAINVITGVTVSGLSNTSTQNITDLGVDVIAAVVVSFTISLELSVLLSRSILRPLGELRRATARVAEGDFTARVPVVANDETGELGAAFNDMVAGLQERMALHEAFGSYVDPEVADRVLAEGAVLQGEEAEVSVLFLDIRGFTAYAEEHDAREVVERLNAFFELVVPVVIRHGGHANKFVGDGLLAVFGAPDRREDHADRAVAAALAIVDSVREEYSGYLRIGIGVNSGTVVAGTVGGGGRLEFAVIGDAVNTASRVESVTRSTDDDVLITEATRALLRRPGYRFEARGTVELKGRREPVALHAPVRSQDGAPSQKQTVPFN